MSKTPTPKLAIDARQFKLKMPRRKNVWVTPRSDSPTAKLVRKHAPQPSQLRWYPDLPGFEDHIWGVWPSGHCGLATYVSAWTFRTASGYINELPVIAWHPMPTP